MIKKIILPVLAVLLSVNCNNKDANTDKETTASDSNKQVKQIKQQDSTNGYAPVNGLKMYYETHGNSGGIPLVLVHGGGSTIKTTFGNILPLLSKHYKVIAVELQAHGHTNDRDKPSSFEQDADDVAGLLGYLKINKADFFGFSNGGNTAMQIAIRHPALVNKLVIASSFYKREGMIPGFFKGMENAKLDNMPAPLKTAFLDIPGNTENGLQVMHDRDKTRMLQFKDWPEKDLLSIKAPALILLGDKDVATIQHAAEMAHIIPNATLMVLPGVHGAAIGEICTTKPGSKIPAITVALIEDFLNNQMAAL